ncbi:hypothetical protein UlMin_027778 [Ulmus minor]
MKISSSLFITTNLLFFCFSQFSNAGDTITQAQQLVENQTLVSKDESFELGFFSPGSSTNRYLGIWYKHIPVQTVVWVANRENPIKGFLSSTRLMIDEIGNLVLLNHNKTIWSAKPMKKIQQPILQLLDSGNLVLRDSENNYSWQSFDYPSDTLLPGMKLGWNFKTGLNRSLSSWKSIDDPSPGDFTWDIQLHAYPEPVMWRGSQKYYRSGPWNGQQFSGAPALKSNPVFDFTYVSNQDELFYTYNLKNKSLVSRVVMNQTTYLHQRYVWSEGDKDWRLYASVPRDPCDNYGVCGPYGNCIISESPVCQCLDGFRPKSPQKWNSMDWTDGCVRNKPLNCSDGFVKYEGLKLPDTTQTWLNTSIPLVECRTKCIQNCSCMAYANSDINGGGSGCVIWLDHLTDIRQFLDGGQDLYIRMRDPKSENTKGTWKVKMAVAVPTAVGVVFVMIFIGYFIHKRMNKFKGKIASSKTEENGQPKEDLELPLFDLSTIASATDNFSTSKKLGEGGFGPVYMGTLENGQEIAVKRLSKSSGQGLNEFKNEVILIAKLQHRNLVKVLGCCIEGEEKMLIYEYMSSKSLDSFIFDQTKGKLLDWSKRFSIIRGIARGLVYLHQDSRLRIIHRDLKASNVLLDFEMTPKISDFGLARIFGGNQTEANTNRVVGTYGYMAPEYASDGLFSVKSDVFSFGITVLEIISGKKNRGFFHPKLNLNLVGHAWRLWKEGDPSELIDECLVGSCVASQVLHCIHVSLLCVQHCPEDRPTMSTVLFMLGTETTALPQPKQPGFFLPEEESPGSHPTTSTNEITITRLEAR